MSGRHGHFAIAHSPGPGTLLTVLNGSLLTAPATRAPIVYLGASLPTSIGFVYAPGPTKGKGKRREGGNESQRQDAITSAKRL